MGGTQPGHHDLTKKGGTALTGARTTMRTHGNLTKWNDERGFGFVSTARGEEVFVHISAFPRGTGRPEVGELISFEMQTTADGKKRAIKAQRAGQAKALPRRTSNRRDRGSAPSVLKRVVLFAAVIAIGAYVYSLMERGVPPVTALPARSSPDSVSARPASFGCDGRTLCSEMKSCEEAQYFSRNCPGAEMDGNGDGEACEQQCDSGDFGR